MTPFKMFDETLPNGSCDGQTIVQRAPVKHDGPTVFAHACKMGLEGIVSKRKDSIYRSGRSPDWLKSKNPACEAGAARGGRGLG
jgi:ATP-dependent DNA ligase